MTSFGTVEALANPFSGTLTYVNGSWEISLPNREVQMQIGQFLLYILVGTSLLGAVVTWLFHIETTGVNLEAI